MITNPRLALAGRARPPPYWTLGYVAVFLIFWTAIPLILQQEPPIDNFEQLNWALHPALGYLKHPPLPTWILWIFEQFAPAGVTLTYVLGAGEVLFTLLIAYGLGKATLDDRRGWLGALLITFISYHTLRLHFYNHNTALLCANAASMACVWRAAGARNWRWWSALGACWAAGMLCKYQMAVPIVCNLAFLGLAMRTDARRLLQGVALAAAVSLALLMPHIVWLVQNNFPTFDYASKSLGAALPAGTRWDGLMRFLASQALRVLPAIVLLSLMQAFARRQPGAFEPAPAQAPNARVFWAIHAIGPLVLMSLLAIIGGVDLQMHWGTAFLWALPMWYLSTARGGRLLRVPARQLFGLSLAVQSLLMIGKILLPDL